MIEIFEVIFLFVMEVLASLSIIYKPKDNKRKDTIKSQ